MHLRQISLHSLGLQRYTFYVLTFSNDEKKRWLGCLYFLIPKDLGFASLRHIPIIKWRLNFLDITCLYCWVLSLKNINHVLSKCVQTTPCCRLASRWRVNISISSDLYEASISTGRMKVGLTLSSKNCESSHEWMPGISIAITAIFDNSANGRSHHVPDYSSVLNWKKLKTGKRKTRTFWVHVLYWTLPWVIYPQSLI